MSDKPKKPQKGNLASTIKEGLNSSKLPKYQAPPPPPKPKKK